MNSGLQSTTTTSTAAPPGVAAASAPPSSNGGMSFHDILEVINPLQHIPVIDTLYRSLTGDTISPAARVAGDALYGGVMGLASSLVNELVQGETGKDIGEHIMSTLFGDDDDKPAAKPATDNTSGPASAPAPGGTVITAPATSGPATSGPSTSISATSAVTPVVAPALAIAAATAGVKTAAAPAQPTAFYLGLQHAGHVTHEVPLQTTGAMPATPSERMAINQSLYASPAKDASASNPFGANPPGMGSPANGSSGSSAANTAAALASVGLPAPVAPPSIPPAAAPAVFSAAPPATNATIASAAPTPAVPNMMMQALDKYKAMMQQQYGAAPAGGNATLIN